MEAPPDTENKPPILIVSEPFAEESDGELPAEDVRLASPPPQPDRTNTSSKLMNMDQLFFIEILPYSELQADTFLDINISSSGRISLEVTAPR